MKRCPGSNDLPEPGSLLFAYGTLQRNGQYHSFLQDCDADFVGSGKLITPYPLILAEYPCLLDMPGSGLRVVGEIYRISNSADWQNIDRLEAHPTEYTRRPEAVEFNSIILQAWTYFYNLPEQLDPDLQPVERFIP